MTPRVRVFLSCVFVFVFLRRLLSFCLFLVGVVFPFIFPSAPLYFPFRYFPSVLFSSLLLVGVLSPLPFIPCHVMSFHVFFFHCSCCLSHRFQRELEAEDVHLFVTPITLTLQVTVDR